MEDSLNLRFKEAKGEVYSLEELAIEDSLGDLTLTLEESAEFIELSFWLEELLLFSESFDKDDLIDFSSDEMAELFSWKSDEINEKVIDWRLTRLRERDLPTIKMELRQRIKQQNNDFDFNELSIEFEDVGWFPNHHTQMPEEAERPYPNLVIEVTREDAPNMTVCQNICFFDGVTNFDFDELAVGVIKNLIE